MSRSTNRQWWRHASVAPRYSRMYSASLLNQAIPHRPEERKDKIAKGILHHIKASLPQGYMGNVGWRDSEWALVVTHPHKSAVAVGTVGDKTIDFRVSDSNRYWMPGDGTGEERETSVLLSDTDFNMKSMAAIMRLVNVVESAKADRDDEFRRSRASKS